MIGRVVVNGRVLDGPAHALDANDRGLAYGDGLFETMRLVESSIRFRDRHLSRLALGCERLGIPLPERALIEQDLALATAGVTTGVVKLIVTRGIGVRGYAVAAAVRPTRIAMLYDPPADVPGHPVALRWCRTSLARNAVLAGIKHLNRLEQVLARAEWKDPAIDEGLMLDTDGRVVCGTASNLFLVIDDTLVTPDLSYCGVRGVMRAAVLDAARAAGMECREREVQRCEVEDARELFVTNAVRGLSPVGQLGDRTLEIGPVSRELARGLGLW